MRVALCIVSVFVWSVPVEAQIPAAALPYKRALIGNARFVWGLNAPVAIVASQIHTESGWRADAKSPYAGGLAQFTASTAADISKRHPDLADNAPFEPSWALRAVNHYDREIFERMTAKTHCDRWAFTLSAYNGGEGNVIKQKRAAKAGGADPDRWFGSVERYRIRAQWAHDENYAYPRRVLLRWQPLYLTWGPGVDCKGVK